ncbi:MAG: bacteriohemerythrin [Polyangiaceae bacterium]
MEWNEKLSVGIAQFDNEHKKLVGMVNNLFDAVQAGRGKEQLGPILDGLITYTKTHFANEEKYMAQHAFPEMAAHKAEHDALTKQVLDVEKKFRAGATAVLSMEVMNFLKNWLVKHIMGTDKHYGPYLNARGVK